ncbi:MAG: PPK2 family polyphosphate kinase [Actinomycetota bacterium]
MAPRARLHLVEPGSAVDVTALDAADTRAAPGDKEATKQAGWGLAVRLAELQDVLWASRDGSVLVILQGIDTSGKGGTVEHVFGAVNPAGLRVVSFKAPTRPELERDYLWRIHAQVPADGEIAVFDRSHYEDVLAVRVEGLAPEEVWRRRFEHINAFEKLLVDEGTTVVKLFLHISKEEQAERLQARLDEPDKHWKFRVEDLDARSRWDDYQAAFSEAISRTSTEHAPWYVIPADKKWYRNWAVATIMIDVLEGLDLRFPAPQPGLDAVVID